MKWWKIALGVFLGLGLLVATVSMYQMSLSGTMKKLGLLGADFAGSVSGENLASFGIRVKAGWECGLVNRVKGATQFILAGDSEQGQLSFRLGEMRVLCGVGMMQSGEVEAGTYEVTKGLGYLTTGYNYVLERGSVDSRVCEGVPGAEVDKAIVGLLESTTGRVHELLYDEWGKVIVLQQKVGEICIDARNSRR